MAPHHALARTLLAATLLAVPLPLAATAAPASAAARAPLPARKVWKRDVAAAMARSIDYLDDRVTSGDPASMAPLAINLDIDNTSLATTYARGRAVAPTLAFAQHAHDLGMAVLFNTGRLAVNAQDVTAQLEAAGYTVDALCTREPGETLPQGKQRCRASFVAQGWTLVANVGNNRTDFVGGDYERAFRLPNYRGRLG